MEVSVGGLQKSFAFRTKRRLSPSPNQAAYGAAKLEIFYRDADERETNRIIWMLVLIYYVDNVMIVAWCELRQSLRHFLVDRIADGNFILDNFEGKGDALIAQWERTQKNESVSTKDF